MLLVSCSKEDVVNSNILSNDKLTFLNEEEINRVISGEHTVPIPKGFAGLLKAKKLPNSSGGFEKGSLQEGSDGSLNEFYETSGYDTLVPNKNLAKLLNEQGEVKVGNLIYRIAPEGTFFYPPDREKRFKELYTTSSNIKGIEVSENLYLVEEGIYRYDTFKEELMIDENRDATLELLKKSTPLLSIPFEDFESYNANPHTWLGKGWSSMFGENIPYTININKERRLKGKFYNYNYVFYSESGILAKMEKKNWIGWSGIKAKELIIGWRGIDVEVNMPQYVKDELPKITKPKVLDYSYGKLPQIYGNGWSLSILFGDLLTQSQEKQIRKLAAKGVKDLFAMLRKNYGISIPSGADNNTDLVCLFTDDKLINIIPLCKIKSVENKEQVRKVFTDDLHIGVTINPLALPSNLVEWGKALIKGTSNLPYPEVVAGDVFVCGRLNTEWVGMRIVKEYK